MRHDLIEMGFKFEMIKQRKPVAESFTPKDHSASIEAALRQMPEDLQVTKIAIESDIFVVKDEIEMQTVIYWKA